MDLQFWGTVLQFFGSIRYWHVWCDIASDIWPFFSLKKTVKLTRNWTLFTAEFLGFEKHRPPFASAKGNEILQGVNYASGGCGIHPDTGRVVVIEIN